MKVYVVTVCFTNQNVFSHGISNVLSTIGCKFDDYVVVDHLYPLNYWQNKIYLARFCAERRLKMITPYKNRGGTGGFNFALKEIEPNDDDIIIGVDPDANIRDFGWGAAMVKVLSENPKLGAVSLLLDAILHNKEWDIEFLSGHKIGFLNKPEMFNVTGWRVDFLKQTRGLQALLPYYGHVEVPMRDRALELGFRIGYLMEYTETFNTIPHDKHYNEWKHASVVGEKKNFDEWLKEKGIQVF